MAHCDNQMTNLVNLSPPLSSAASIFSHDALPAGKGKGLGCSSNGQFAACSFQDPAGNNLIFYDSTGARIWASGSLLDQNAYASAPAISDSGDVIAADDHLIVRLTSAGDTVWSTANPGGIPVSPVIIASGAVVTAAYTGPISAFDGVDGHLIGSLTIPGPLANNYFDTINTPCVNGNRIYVSMQLENGALNVGALVAMDINAANPTRPITVAWSFLFGSPSGASPLCVANTIYFDGASRYPGVAGRPQIFAVQDNGTSASLLWHAAVPNVLPGNLGLDPRGGMWAMFTGVGTMERFDALTGKVIDTLRVSSLVGAAQTNYPYSAITMAGTATDPIMLLGTANQATTDSHVVAIDLPTHSVLWNVQIAPVYGTDDAPSQFPIMLDASGNPVVVFAGRSSGAFFVKAPAAFVKAQAAQ